MGRTRSLSRALKALCLKVRRLWLLQVGVEWDQPTYVNLLQVLEITGLQPKFAAPKARGPFR